MYNESRHIAPTSPLRILFEPTCNSVHQPSTVRPVIQEAEWRPSVPLSWLPPLGSQQCFLASLSLAGQMETERPGFLGTPDLTKEGAKGEPGPPEVLSIPYISVSLTDVAQT